MKDSVFLKAVAGFQLAQKAETGKASAVFGQGWEFVGGVKGAQFKGDRTRLAALNGVKPDLVLEIQPGNKELGLNGAGFAAKQRVAGIKPDAAKGVIGQVKPVLRNGRWGRVGGGCQRASRRAGR